jgi:hypothetical protein
LNYIDALADAIREQVPPDLVPDGDTTVLFRIYALLALVRGDGVQCEDVHDAWSAWISASDPGHPSVVAYADLTPDVQAADAPYAEAIRAVARRRGLHGR